MDDAFVPVGRVGRPHGLDGAFVVEHGSDDESRYVVGRDVQHEDESAVAFLGVHAHGVGIVDELAREIREQFGH